MSVSAWSWCHSVLDEVNTVMSSVYVSNVVLWCIGRSCIYIKIYWAQYGSLRNSRRRAGAAPSLATTFLCLCRRRMFCGWGRMKWYNWKIIVSPNIVEGYLALITGASISLRSGWCAEWRSPTFRVFGFKWSIRWCLMRASMTFSMVLLKITDNATFY